ncbi:hypothetical protein TNCV_1996671 [Trichonephila clavipes]|uniref:Uncharacterized protein n=1 Tax=Trichonephila clavipes TaxID=2585209 RepID=A0A8X6RLY2_TRICX|nr:hypothetical protein TNCV_1996671 [Trichonephila clavipes]
MNSDSNAENDNETNIKTVTSSEALHCSEIVKKHNSCNGFLPGEAISSSTRPKSVRAKARPIIMLQDSDPYRNSNAFSDLASFPSPTFIKLQLYTLANLHIKVFESIRWALAADFFILKQKIKTSRERPEFGSTATAGSYVVQSGRPIFDDFFQHLWPYIGNNTANVVFQMVKRLWLIRIDQ